MPRTANRSGDTTPRKTPPAKNSGDAVLEALNADRAAPDHSQQRQEKPQAEGGLPEKPARSRPTH